jgi:hypothetical protein
MLSNHTRLTLTDEIIFAKQLKYSVSEMMNLRSRKSAINSELIFQVKGIFIQDIQTGYTDPDDDYDNKDGGHCVDGAVRCTCAPSGHLQRVTIPDAILIQFDLLMMSMLLLETCRAM